MRLVPVHDVDGDQLVRVREIYEDGFGEHLRAPFDTLLADRVHVLVDGDEPRGLAVLRALGPTGWVFLRYFVVGLRGRGHGEVLWTALREAMSEAGFERIVLDVEDPADPDADDAEQHVRRRRIAFYDRLGVALLPAAGYGPPQDGEHEEAPHPMLLMAADLDRDRTAPYRGEELRRVLLAVHEHRYGLAESDPVVQRTLRMSGLAPSS